MKPGGYKVHEFARLAGVTVRTLHHYDRIGILKPRRNPSGFRIYTDADFERLEKIIALKFIGLPLHQIGTVLSGDKPDFGSALRNQLGALEEKKRRLEAVIQVVRDAEASVRSGGTADLKRIIEVMEMETNHEWILQHFSAGARQRVDDRLALMTPSTWLELQREWVGLADDIHATVNTDPGSPESQALLSRWEKLIRRTTGDDPELVHGLKSLYSDREHWPEPVRQTLAPLLDDRILEFVKRAVAARRGSASA